MPFWTFTDVTGQQSDVEIDKELNIHGDSYSQDSGDEICSR
jgi:hypothetical protein